MADDEMYLQNLQEFVVQEERIVTYKWLSRTLSVNVNQAKQMLYAFVQHQQKNKNAISLSILYIIGGIIKTGNGSLVQKYLFAHENNLEDIKQCYDKLTSLHIYSVQKSNPKDSNILYMADYDLQKENLDCPNRWSNITCKLASKRALEIPNKDENNDKENKEKEKTMSNEVHKPLNSNPKVPLKSGPSTSKKTSKSTAKSSMKKGDVASFFARQVSSNNKVEAQKSNDVKEREDQSPKNDETKTNDENKLESDQMDKSDSKSKEEITKEEKETEPTATDNKQPESKTEDVDKGETSNTTKKPSPNQAEKKKKTTKGQKEKDEEKPKKSSVKRNKSKNSAKEEKDESDEENERKRKKRKRVKNFSDSEEEAEPANLKQSAGSTPVPDQQLQQETVKKTESIVPQKVRRRKRVLKSKMYLNDDGYMVTEKLYESESTDGSDVEMKEITAPEKKVENNAAEKEKTAPAKKKPANKATKQSSLTNFFKKS